METEESEIGRGPMRELVQRAKERLRSRQTSEEKGPAQGAQNTNTLESVNGLVKSATTLGTLAFTFWAVKTLGGLWNAAKQGIEDEQRAERNEEKARRDLAETKQRSDEKDTKAIRRQISEDWVNRERKNLPPAPKSIRGHWEGHVFIPNEQPGKPAKGPSKSQPKPATKPKTPAKATGG